MDSDEMSADRAKSGAELAGEERSCERRGSPSKVYSETAEIRIGAKTGAEVTHIAGWSAESYTILFSLLAFLTAAFYGILAMFPTAAAVKVPLAFGWLAIPVLLFWQRYRVLMCVRYMGRKFTASKTERIG